MKIPKIIVSGAKTALSVGIVFGGLGTVAACLTGQEKDAIACGALTGICTATLIGINDIEKDLKIDKINDKLDNINKDIKVSQ